MRTSLKLSLTALAAACLLASAITTASANSLSVSNTDFRVVWDPLQFGEGFFSSISCDVTIEGSFHESTIAKIRGSLIGHVTRAAIDRDTCTGPFGVFADAAVHNGIEEILGETPANSLPWHVSYESFDGSLPSITSVNLLLTGLEFTLDIPANGCLGIYGGPAANITGEAVLEGGGSNIDFLRPDPNASLPLTEGTEGCPDPGVFSGNGAVTLLGTNNPISVTLI